MKILMISSFLPYPLYSGGHVRLFNLIKELSGKHEITLVCEMRENQSKDDLQEVDKVCKKVVTVNRKKQWSIENFLRSISSKNSFLTIGHTHKEMQDKIKEELEREKFDLVHVETFYVSQNLPDSRFSLVLAEHNVEYMVYKKFADRAPLFLGSILNLDIAKIKKEEENSWQRADKLIAVSENDAKIMEEKGLKPIIVSNGVDTKKFSFKNQESSFGKLRTSRIKNQEKKILFIGDFNWIQNIDAVKYIIKEIFPKIKVNDSVKLWIVGRKIPDSIKNMTNDPRIFLDEISSSRPTEELFQEADMLLAPIRVGGGTSYKILESMSCGTPVVTTELSAEAINATDEKNILVGKTAEELAKKTLKVLSDPKLYKTIAKNGRKLIEENYTWKKIANDLEKVYKSLV